MLVVVNLPHTNGFKIEGNIPGDFLNQVRKTFGSSNVSMYHEEEIEDDELINPFETEWFKNLKAQETPGGNLRFYRKLNHLTQPQLAEKLGTSKQTVSQMENDKRPISGKTARQLSIILGVDVSRFIF